MLAGLVASTPPPSSLVRSNWAHTQPSSDEALQSRWAFASLPTSLTLGDGAASFGWLSRCFFIPCKMATLTCMACMMRLNLDLVKFVLRALARGLRYVAIFHRRPSMGVFSGLDERGQWCQGGSDFALKLDNVRHALEDEAAEDARRRPSTSTTARLLDADDAAQRRKRRHVQYILRSVSLRAANSARSPGRGRHAWRFGVSCCAIAASTILLSNLGVKFGRW